MFEQVKYDDYDSDEEEDTDIISRIINAPTRQVKTRVFTTAFYYGCLGCKSILVILSHKPRESPKQYRSLNRTLLRATAGIVLLASIFVGVYLAWENRSGIAEAAMRTKRLAMG